DNFVPGYTQVYAFEDGRTNQNPTICTDRDPMMCPGDNKRGNVNGIIVQELDDNDNLVSGGIVKDGDTVASCSVSEANRSTAGGCGRTNPYKACSRYQITVDVPDDVAEPDPSSTDMNGNPLHEIVWVDYFADGGDIETPVLLVSDAIAGIQRNTD